MEITKRRSSLKDKQIVLGISGGIAAYKCAELVRLLKKAGAQVRVVLTKAAPEFVTPLTLHTLSGNPVYQAQLDADMAHIELARWASVLLIAPATAHCLAKLALGLADDTLSALCLATQAPLIVVPAMNSSMWHHLATQANVKLLQQRQIKVLDPDDGVQACGDVGEGRMLEPSAILDALHDFFSASQRLAGKTVLITAGPTQEALDPVRFLSNASSGKMGYALAKAAQAEGARVILVSGPTALLCPVGVERIEVCSAVDMLAAVMQHAENCHLFIATAAVADYRPAQQQPQKIKKAAQTIHLELTRNPDIVQQVANLAKRPLVIGFAAETEQLIEHAQQKRLAKNLDMIIANEVGVNKGFHCDNHQCVAMTADHNQVFSLMPKDQLAIRLIDHIINTFEKRL